jgi:hypothetical protein
MQVVALHNLRKPRLLQPLGRLNKRLVQLLQGFRRRGEMD